MSATTSLHDIKTLVQSFHPVIIIETVEEDRIRAILADVAQQTRQPLFEWSVTRGLTNAEDGPGVHRLTATPQSLLQHLEGLTLTAIFLLKDCARYLEDPALARRFREVATRVQAQHSTLVLTGATVELPRELEHLAVRYDLQLPSAAELGQVVDTVIRSLGSGTLRMSDPPPSNAGGSTHPASRRAHQQITPEVRQAMLQALQGMTLHQARQAVTHTLIEAGRITTKEIPAIVARKAQMIRDGGLLEYYPVEDNRFQLGGFASLKAWLARARVGFSPEAKALNLTAPRGILIVGVPGCGKSLAAKVIARDWMLPLLKLDAGRLFDKYVGESEKNFRQAITLAESMAPVVFWIDEIEKGMVAAGSGEADAGLSRRLFGAFLTWLQEKRHEVFVVATANDLSILPPELLRKGRFDEVFFVDLPDGDERHAIWKIHLTLRKQDPARIDLTQLVEATEGFSGSEIEQAVVAGLYRALHQKCLLDTALLLEEIRQTVPLSVSRREDITRLRSVAEGRFVPVR